MKMNVECPECGRPAVVHEKQDQFVCSDENGCAFMCEMETVTGTLECVDGQWFLFDTGVK